MLVVPRRRRLIVARGSGIVPSGNGCGPGYVFGLRFLSVGLVTRLVLLLWLLRLLRTVKRVDVLFLRSVETIIGLFWNVILRHVLPSVLVSVRLLPRSAACPFLGVLSAVALISIWLVFEHP